MAGLTPELIKELNNLYGFPESSDFELGTYLLQNSTTVDDALDRNAIPAADRASGMLVKTAASGIVWILDDDLTTWTPIDNQNPDIYVNDPALGLPVHNIFVETPANGGSDTDGEGTAPAPFATPTAALAATISQGTQAYIFINVGAGSFAADSLNSPTLNFVTFRGSINILATIPLASQTPVGLVAGKVAQFRTDIGAYGFAVTEGDTYAKTVFPGFEDFPSYRVALGTSASPNIDLVNTSAPTGDLIIFEQLTTFTSTGSLRAGFTDGAIRLEALKIRPGSGFLSIKNTTLAALDCSSFGGSNFASTADSSASSCYFDIASLQFKPLSDSIIRCLIESAVVSIAETPQTQSISIVVTRENGTAFSIGSVAGTLTRGTAKIFGGAIDLEDGSGIIVNGKGSTFVLQSSITAGTADPVTRALLVQNGGFYERSSGTWIGSTAGVCVVVDTQGFVDAVVASFDGTLANSSAAGDEITVGGNAVAAFSTVPLTDFALGNTSRGAIAR